LSLVTQSSSAEPSGRSRPAITIIRVAVVLAGMATAILLAAKPARAAEADFHYQAGLNETYSQDVFRDGSNQDDFISDVVATANLLVKSPRSEATFSYLPEYLLYKRYDTLNHFDQRFLGSWSVHPGARSEFSLREGFSNTTRRVGFQDLAGAGASGSQPVTGITRLLAWDVEPHWSLKTGPNGAISAGALYRSERYDAPELVDSDHFGANWGMDGPVGRYQRLGGQVRVDAYQYSLDEGSFGPAYDRFINGQGTWSLKEGEQTTLSVAAGVYRGSGKDLDPVTGPTFDLTGNWRWRRSFLSASLDSGYSTGGGLSTTDRSYQAAASWTAQWGHGSQIAIAGDYIRREPIGETTGPTTPLYGRSGSLWLSHTWLTGMGVRMGVTTLRQDQTGSNGLSYGEATFGLTYSPPVPAPRPVPAT
jgi:hypothetical protein